MTTATLSPPRERALRAGLFVLGAASLAIGVFQAVDPTSFVDEIGPFGESNAHYVRDLATWSVAYGVVLLLAAGRPSWRVPALAFGVVQGALHLVNHVMDAGEADPGWMGPLNAVLLAGVLGVTVWLLLVAREVRP